MKKESRVDLALWALCWCCGISSSINASATMIVTRDLFASTATPVRGSLEQSADVLKTLDQVGTQDTWGSYIEITPASNDKFLVEFSFALPDEDGTCLALTIHSNTIGEGYPRQVRTFEIKNIATGEWVQIGDNSGGSDWEWYEQDITISEQLSSYIGESGEILIRFGSNNDFDVCNVDYLALEAVIETLILPGNGGPPTPTPSSWWKPKASDGMTWQWQLQGTIDTSLDVDMYDIDLFDTPTSTIEALKASGHKVVCYFSGGTYEGWREDWAEFFPFIAGSSYSGNEPPFAGNMAEWDERWLDIRRLDLLAPIMESRLDLAVEKGCDAVEPDNMDAYANAVEVNLSLTGNDQLEYNKWFAQKAHERGLSIGLKNDVAQLEDLVDYFDWALNEQCFQYNECDNYSAFTSQDKAVFGVEYTGSPSTFCPQANQMNLSWLKKKLDLKIWRIGCENY